MTITHLSHFGLTEIGRTNESIVFEGNLSACKRLAFSHGLELGRELFRTMAIDGRSAKVDTTDTTGWELEPKGLILKSRDGWCLVLPLNVWLND